MFNKHNAALKLKKSNVVERQGKKPINTSKEIQWKNWFSASSWIPIIAVRCNVRLIANNVQEVQLEWRVLMICCLEYRVLLIIWVHSWVYISWVDGLLLLSATRLAMHALVECGFHQWMDDKTSRVKQLFSTSRTIWPFAHFFSLWWLQYASAS